MSFCSLLIAPMPNNSLQDKKVNSEEVMKLIGYSEIDFNYITLLGGFAGEQYVFQSFFNS